MNLADVNIPEFYERIETLSVDFEFREELGFPYLQQKLAEIIEKDQKSARLLLALTRLLDQLDTFEGSQRVLYNVTGVIAHKEKANEAKDLGERVRNVLGVLKVYRERLKRLPMDIRTYMRLLEDGLQAEPFTPGTEHQRRERVVPSVLSQVPAEEPYDTDAVEDLFR